MGTLGLRRALRLQWSTRRGPANINELTLRRVHQPRQIVKPTLGVGPFRGSHRRMTQQCFRRLEGALRSPELQEATCPRLDVLAGTPA